MAQHGQITASTLNLRTASNADSLIIASFRTGTMIEILSTVTGGDYSTINGTQNKWHQVKVDGKTGFMAAFFIIETGSPTTTSNVLNAIFKVNAEHLYYRARDITGDGIKETFCNWFIADVLDQLGIKVPRLDTSAGSYVEPHPIYGNNTPFKPFSAEALFKFFEQTNPAPDKWKLVSSQTNNSNAENTAVRNAAISIAQDDKVVVVSFPGRRGSDPKQGHIAIVRPDSSVTNVRIAQAGRISSNNLSLNDGFGSVLDVSKFFTFTG